MRTETVLDMLDSVGSVEGQPTFLRQPLPGLSREDIESLKLQGNPVAEIAGETTDKEYIQLHRYRNVISNSILAGLHACPRKLIQEKLEAAGSMELTRERAPNIDFVFGHSVGAGAQTLLTFERLDYALYAALISWRAPFDFGKEDYLKRKKKTIERAVIAVESFSYFRNSVLEDWELFYLPSGKPAVEISFCIDLGKTKYFGHIDSILRNKRTHRIAIGEFKTSGYANPDDAAYRNSGQALGYAVVLDAIVGGLADYDVNYIVYSAPEQEWIFFPFAKSVSSKMEWIQDRLIDSGHLEQYFQLEHFPKNGANCLMFNRRCQFYGSCDLVDKEKMRELPALDSVDNMNYPVDYYFHIDELVNRQLENVT